MGRGVAYDTDILEWSEQQASVLRGLARTRRDLPNELDLEHVAEEIEDVGRSEFVAVQSLVRLILVHLVKAVSVPDAESMLHWRKEVVGFHTQILDRITPSMATRLDLPKLWQQAIKQADVDLAVYGQSVSALPSGCPMTVDEIVSPAFDFLETAARLRQQIDAGDRHV